MKYFTIGSDSDYSTIETFIEDTYPDLLTDDDAPYVGLLTPEIHTYGTRAITDTDSKHHYIFEPLGKKWMGTETSDGCAIIDLANYVGQWPNYTEIKHCVFNSSISSTEIVYNIIASHFAKVFSCLFNNISITCSLSDAEKTCSVRICAATSSNSNICENCVFDGLSLNAPNVQQGRFVTDGLFINCVFMNFDMVATNPLIYFSDYANSLAGIYYSLIHFNGEVLEVEIQNIETFHGNSYFNQLQSPTDNITYNHVDNNALEFDFRNELYPNTYFFDPTSIHWSNSAISMWNLNRQFTTINGCGWTNLWHSIGLSHLNKNLLHLTQFNKGLVFNVKTQPFYDIF